MANKIAYPVVLTPDERGYLVYVPAFNIDTSGRDMADAMEMARDAIGIVGIEYQDQGKDLPAADEGDFFFKHSSFYNRRITTGLQAYGINLRKNRTDC